MPFEKVGSAGAMLDVYMIYFEADRWAKRINDHVTLAAFGLLGPSWPRMPQLSVVLTV